MRKIILVIVCLMLIGCGKQDEKPVENISNNTEELIKITSDDKKIVYLDEDKYLVFSYVDNNITGYKIYLDYKSIDSAINTLDIVKVNYSNNVDILSVTREAQFIVVTYKDEYVKKNYTSVDELKKSLSELKEIK